VGLASNNIKSDVVEAIDKTCGIDDVLHAGRAVTPGAHIQNLKHTAAVSKINISRSKVQIIFTVTGIEGELLRGVRKNVINPTAGKTDPTFFDIDPGSALFEHLQGMGVEDLNPYAF
jgi:hypothetical protein